MSRLDVRSDTDAEQTSPRAIEKREFLDVVPAVQNVSDAVYNLMTINPELRSLFAPADEQVGTKEATTPDNAIQTEPLPADLRNSLTNDELMRHIGYLYDNPQNGFEAN